MSKLLKSLIVILLIAGFAGCSVKTDDIQVVAFKSDKANLKGYKTYQIIEGSCFLQDSEGNRVPDKMQVGAEIHKMVKSELTNRGKVPVNKNPDFFVAYAAAADVDAFKKKVDEAGKEKIDKTPESAMLLILFDANTGAIIWLSQAEGEIRDLPVDQVKKRLRYTVKKMFSGM
ncbi:MAG: DUF4136 domain-containing protein [Campylobacterota bacterium]|nr:DUF4136 domain-containing protein [Campylobacterota bacterium]